MVTVLLACGWPLGTIPRTTSDDVEDLAIELPWVNVIWPPLTNTAPPACVSATRAALVKAARGSGFSRLATKLRLGQASAQSKQTFQERISGGF